MRGHYVAALIDLLVERGVDRAEFLQDCQLQEDELNADTLIDQRRLERVTRLAAERVQETGIGLLVGRRLNINTHGALGYAAMASASYEQALQLLVKFYSVQAPKAYFELRTCDGYYELACESSFTLPERPWVTTEFLISSIYTSTEFLLSGRMQGVEIHLGYAEPPHVALYREMFQAPVRFQQTFTGILIPFSVARQPLPSADPLAASLFTKRCESIQHDDRDEQLPRRVKEMLYAGAGEFPSQTELASRLHMSVSTLHRKLAEQGATYKALLAEVKKELALQHLRDSRLTVDEIAQLLGFSDASNFRRAFVGWTGETPSEFRKRCL
ncbi:AraC family transcriptional regulator [Hahella sp. NBU794]|uniref:AraC family transcriptional regulator n=1 Tax=Hahella sp. NBU794 TaxID=3422590 RepID=UPI003D6F02D5